MFCLDLWTLQLVKVFSTQHANNNVNMETISQTHHDNTNLKASSMQKCDITQQGEAMTIVETTLQLRCPNL